MTTKILALTDALGNLVRFVLLPGQRFDTVGVAPLIKDIEFGGLIADKAFDSNWIIEEMNERGAQIVISQHPRRIQPLKIDRELYKWRHLIENFFGKCPRYALAGSRSHLRRGSWLRRLCPPLCVAPSRGLLRHAFKGIAMRACKTDTSFEAMIYVCSGIINSR